MVMMVEKAVQTDTDFLDNVSTESIIPETGSAEAQISALEDRKRKLEKAKAKIASEMEVIEAKLEKCFDLLQEECENEETETMCAEMAASEGPSKIESKRLPVSIYTFFQTEKVDKDHDENPRKEKKSKGPTPTPSESSASVNNSRRASTSNRRTLMSDEENKKILKEAIDTYKTSGKIWRKNTKIVGIDRKDHVLRKKALRLIQDASLKRLTKLGLNEERALKLKAKCKGIKT